MAPEFPPSPPQALAPATGGAAATSGTSSKQILVEKCLASESSKRRRVLSKRDSEELVCKALADIYSQFTSKESDGVIHEGKTLTQRLQEDKRKQSKVVSLRDMLQLATQIQAGDLYKFCNKNAQGTINVATEVLGQMMQRKPPVIPSQAPQTFRSSRMRSSSS